MRIFFGSAAGNHKRNPIQAAIARLRLFRRAEDGSMVVLSLFLILVMAMTSGIAIDLMRYEATRARLQSTLDRAVLAATDLDQNMPAREVVEDFFAKDGLLEQLDEVTVIEAINSRSVRALASLSMNTLWMRLLGVNSLTAPAAGTAIEAVSDIEILLVLDVSGSMGNTEPKRIDNLEIAAVEFVQTVLAVDDETRVSIGIVPFNGQVNLGPVLRGQYNATDNHGVANVNCIDLPAGAYVNSDMSTTLEMPMTAHADTFSGSSTTSGGGYVTTLQNTYYQQSYNTPNASNRWCPPSTVNTVMVPTRDETRLIQHIRNLTAIGATSINAGMRWGLELVDPGSRPMFGNLISAGQIPSAFSDRPYNYGRDNTLKVIVLMSDGENFAEERILQPYLTGLSNIWRSNAVANTGSGQPNTNFLSIFHPSKVDRTNATTICNSRPYWVPHRSQWNARPWNGSTTNASNHCYDDTVHEATLTGPRNHAFPNGNATRLLWQEVWLEARVQWLVWQMWGRPDLDGNTSADRSRRYNAQLALMRRLTPIGQMDAELQVMCNLAKSNRVTVYAIAFEAPVNGQLQLSQCASSPSHYFNAQGLQIQTAFRAIAAQINSLRLIE